MWLVQHAMTKARKPSVWLKLLDWAVPLPEIMALKGCEQDPEWHPEGDVWSHTLHCLDAFAKGRLGNKREDLIVGLAVLCHDLGKPATTMRQNGRITSHNHEDAGEIPTEMLLNRLGFDSLTEEVVPLVKRHLRPMELYKQQATPRAVRRLARHVNIDRLLRVAKADMQGRPPLLGDFPAEAWIKEMLK